MRANRDEWRRRVARWAKSGKSAEEFAAAGGFHPATLRHWKYRLRRDEEEGGAARDRRRSARARGDWPLVEVLGAPAMDLRFEVELRGGRRVRVPAQFDVDALRHLLAVLEEETR
jgi:transposase